MIIRIHKKENIIDEVANLETGEMGLYIIKDNQGSIIFTLIQQIAIDKENQDESISKSILGQLELTEDPWREDRKEQEMLKLNEIGQILTSFALNKYGPLLYDIALSYACNDLGLNGIVSDITVSAKAQGIYKQWMQKEKGATNLPIRVITRSKPKSSKLLDQIRSCVFSTVEELTLINELRKKHKVYLSELIKNSIIDERTYKNKIVKLGDELFTNQLKSSSYIG